jgi:hypothetical protein
MKVNDERAKELKDLAELMEEWPTLTAGLLDLLSDRETYERLVEAAKLVSAEWNLVMAGKRDAHLTGESFDALDEALRAREEEE